tara:strand:+ start:116 stop:412 length:297 start_codon:yes stop_codon:yes gene_type:complete
MKKLLYKLLIIVLFSSCGGKKSSNSSYDNESESGPGSSYCQYAIEDRINSIGGMHTGIEYKGNGKFMAFVANSTTNYEYRVTYFYTNSDCEITNVKVQ